MQLIAQGLKLGESAGLLQGSRSSVVRAAAAKVGGLGFGIFSPIMFLCCITTSSSQKIVYILESSDLCSISTIHVHIHMPTKMYPPPFLTPLRPSLPSLSPPPSFPPRRRSSSAPRLLPGAGCQLVPAPQRRTGAGPVPTPVRLVSLPGSARRQLLSRFPHPFLALRHQRPLRNELRLWNDCQRRYVVVVVAIVVVVVVKMLLSWYCCCCGSPLVQLSL